MGGVQLVAWRIEHAQAMRGRVRRLDRRSSELQCRRPPAYGSGMTGVDGLIRQQQPMHAARSRAAASSVVSHV